MDIFGIFTLFGGLAFFLYGMNTMGDGLAKVSGGKLERILAKLTSSPVKAVLFGAFVTVIIQSSSATTVMVVGFVNSGIMKLSQAIGIAGSRSYWSHLASFCKQPAEKGYRKNPCGICHSDVWHGYDERGGKTSGRCAGIYSNPYDV